jgi:phosphate transport system substrate-binding protein
MRKLFLILFIITIYSCSTVDQTDQNIIKIKGSDTMLLLNRSLAEEFMKQHPGISIYVEGGGSGSGFQSLLEEQIDICAASRPIEPNEIVLMGEKFNTVGLSFLVARDALSIYVNPNNPIKNLSLDQINDIYTCKISNWKELGGEDQKIIRISRSNASGTYLYFLKHVLGGNEICDSVVILNTTHDIVEFVRYNNAAIGYGGLGYAEQSMQVKVNTIEPTEKNVIDNIYPISRYLRYYTVNKPSGNVKEFIDWVTDERGQKIVKSMGYISLYK